MSQRRKKARKCRTSLAGTGLFLHGSGIYYYRVTDPRTGKRQAISTGQTQVTLAIEEAKRLREDAENAKQGRPTRGAWELELVPLAETWAALGKKKHHERETQNRRMRIFRAFDRLGLRVTGDLLNVAQIDDRLRQLEGEETAQNLRRGYQKPLQQFSKWLAGNSRHLDRDPLASWEPIAFEMNPEARRALEPTEVARSLLALDWLGEQNGHVVPQRILFTALLVTGGRVGSVVDRTVGALDHEASRLDLGPPVGKKKRGVAALDEKTFAEVRALTDGRADDEILFLGPRKTKLDPSRTIDMWLQAVSLGVVVDLWPKKMPGDLNLALLVSRSLRSKQVRVDDCGNPRRMTPRRRDDIEKRRRQIVQMMNMLQADWAARMGRVDVHSLRKSHRTWAELLGVPVPFIDKQLGHSSFSCDTSGIEKAVLGSRTGARHYFDMTSDMVRAGESAKAVRKRLDEAVVEILASDSMLARWAQAAVA
jgi:integrase